MAKIQITTPGFRCDRCKHEWIPRVKIREDPIICPKCKSPYWNIPKKRKNISLKLRLLKNPMVKFN